MKLFVKKMSNREEKIKRRTLSKKKDKDEKRERIGIVLFSSNVYIT
jgi:hypothetical protein